MLVTIVGLFALIGLTLVVLLGNAMTDALNRRNTYRERLKALNSANGEIGHPPGGEFSPTMLTVRVIVGEYEEIIDSLGLVGQVRGVRLFCDLRPRDFVVDASDIEATADIFLDCGCDHDGFYDLITIGIDPIAQHAAVRRNYERISFEQYQTLPPLERR